MDTIFRWLQKTWQNLLFWIVLALAVTIILGYIFNWEWVGVGPYIGPKISDNREFQRSKTVWDWLEILVIPIVLGLGIWWLNKQERENEQDIAEKQRKEDRDIAEKKQAEERNLAKDRQNHNILGTYFDRMTELLLTQRQFLSKEEYPARSIARTRTINVLHQFKEDVARRRQVLYFLNESRLCSPLPAEAGAQGETDSNGYAIFREIDLNGIDFCGDKLQNIDFAYANLSGASLEGTKFDNVEMVGVSLTGGKLQRSHFTGCTLIEARLDGARLDGAQFEDVNLTGANLRGSIMPRASFKNADLSVADLSNVALQEANLQGAILDGIDLNDSDLSGAKLIGADIKHPKLVGTILDEQTEIEQKWRTAWEIVNNKLTGNDLSRQDLSQTNLDGADLSGIDLSEANLSGATLNSADLSDTDLTLAILSDVEIDDETIISAKWHLVWELVNQQKVEDDLLEEFALLTPELSEEARYRDLSYKDLRGAQLSGADLTNASLIGTDFRGADLRKTKLSGADLRRAFLTGALIPENLPQQVSSLAGAVMQDGFIYQANQTLVKDGLRLLETMLGANNGT